MGIFKNDVGRPSNKKRLLRKLLIVLIIIIFILLVVAIYLCVNRFPYSGYKYEDDNWNVIHFHKNGTYTLAAVDAGDDLSMCDNEKYLYNKKQNRLNLYCGSKLVEQYKIIEISENDFVAEYINIKEPDNEKHIWHWKKGTTYYSEYSPTYESRMNKVGNNVIKKLVGKAFYFENRYYKDNKISVTVYFKDKDTVLYNFNGDTYKVNPSFSNYSGKMIDIDISFCGNLSIIYDIESNKIVYTNGKEKSIKDINIDMNDIKNKEDYDYVCDSIYNEIYKDKEFK